MERAAPAFRRVRTIAASLCALLACLPCAAALAQAPGAAAESSVRAAFLYQFGNYVEWPAGTQGGTAEPFVIAVLGADDVLHELERITRGRSLGGRPVRVTSPSSTEALVGATVVYVDESAAEQLPAIAARARARGTLLVCATAAALEQGCMIGFARTGSRLRFDVSLDALDAAGLKVSSRLLAVARSVQGMPR